MLTYIVFKIVSVVTLALFSMYVETLLALDSSPQEITVKNLTLSRSVSLIGLLANRTIGRRETVECYHEFLIYADLIKERHIMRTHGVRVIQVTASAFREYSNTVPDKVTDNMGTEQQLRVFSAPFVPFRITMMRGTCLKKLLWELKEWLSNGRIMSSFCEVDLCHPPTT